jgi:hypothetical protein
MSSERAMVRWFSQCLTILGVTFCQIQTQAFSLLDLLVGYTIPPLVLFGLEQEIMILQLVGGLIRIRFGLMVDGIFMHMLEMIL